jgi:hypothetical protein
MQELYYAYIKECTDTPEKHRNMILAALIAVLARHRSNRDLPRQIFRARYSKLDYDLSDSTKFEMFYRYCWTMRVAAPLFVRFKNQGHSLRLLPRLVEARNVEYNADEPSSDIKFRITIVNVEIDIWTNTSDYDQFTPLTTQAPLVQGITTTTSPGKHEPTAAAMSIVDFSTKELPAEKRLRTETRTINLSPEYIAPTFSPNVTHLRSKYEFSDVDRHCVSTLCSSEAQVEGYALYWMESITSHAMNEELGYDLSMALLIDTLDEREARLIHSESLAKQWLSWVIHRADEHMKKIARGNFDNGLNTYGLVTISPSDYQEFSNIERILWILPIVYQREGDTLLISDIELKLRSVEAPSGHMPVDLPSFVQQFVNSFNQHIKEMVMQEEIFRELHACYHGFAIVCLLLASSPSDRVGCTLSHAIESLTSLINSVRYEESARPYLVWEILFRRILPDEGYVNEDASDHSDMDGGVSDAATSVEDMDIDYDQDH